ncbi:expressed unknown protein [Seminavis robusta]|uniref:Uncharacterized protein n=1 Tax=Seminavis robusta TaxID=568900 RepID=A0A9N8D8I1_9STRA|nr:expressed unknown protein [Seminavis robusta]|eukprot:Sro37_g023100.1 n/a (538) ;mRNA; f:27635-29479
MGGTTSKFEETDWIRADGKLSNVTDTIDGRPPTSQYGVYYITKTKLNQREFEVTDLEKNLLYSTKCVPGTLCWFDVYGSGLDECLLRVQVDLSRRYWLVYRMGIPCFAGQLADREATDKLAHDRRETGQDLTATPFLFRKCCICVSWSRYMAVAMQYGAPEGIDLLERRKTNGITEDSESSFFHHAAQITDRMRRRNSEESLLEEEDEENEQERDYTRRLDASEKTLHNQSSPDFFYSYDATNDVMDKSVNKDNNSNDDDLGSSINNSEQTSTSDLVGRASEMRQSISEWVNKKKQEIQDNKKKQMRSDPLEGILHLEKPILLCQEIYDKLIGNHQSSLLSKERAIEYLREDLEQHMNDGGFDDSDDPFLADQEGIRAQLEALRRAEEESKGSNSNNKTVDEKDTNNNNSLGDGDDDGTAVRNSPTTDETPVPSTDAAEVVAEDATKPDNSNNKAEAQVDSNDTADGSKDPSDDGQQQEAKNPEDESLIGYWKWENTWKVHQMKMHVAQGSDLALHVVMAIIANQVRYERNAIAMTV